MQVFWEPLCRRHYSSIFSVAYIFRVLLFCSAVVLAFVIAYGTGGFWPKVRTELEQPTVHYSGDALAILEVGCRATWHDLQIGIKAHSRKGYETESCKLRHVVCIHACLHGLSRGLNNADHVGWSTVYQALGSRDKHVSCEQPYTILRCCQHFAKC